MGKDEEGYFLLKAPIGMLLAFGLSMLQSGLIYNVCQLELVDILKLANVNKLQHCRNF